MMQFVIFYSTECKTTERGHEYRGALSKTKSGYTCQAWSSQTPHKHSRTPQNYLSAGLVNNYCRNPDNSLYPWCYTTSTGKRWEYCDVKICSGQYKFIHLAPFTIHRA